MKTMRKALSVLLVLALLLGMGSAAQAAENEYKCIYMKDLKRSASDLVASNGVRLVTAAGLTLDHYLNAGVEFLNNIPMGKTGYIAAWSVCVDLYIPLSNGLYQNIFYAPTDSTYTDFGECRYNPSSDHTYYSFTTNDLFTTILEILGDD